MESAHANAKASVSGHRLDFGGESTKCVIKKEEIFQSQEENGI